MERAVAAEAADGALSLSGTTVSATRRETPEIGRLYPEFESYPAPRYSSAHPVLNARKRDAKVLPS